MLVDQVIAGKYRITELIGQGGMGTVFEAVHTGTGSRVAIKVIVSRDVKAEVFVRFQREARAAGAIDSRHIVRIFDMGTDDHTGSPYMVMERLVGEDLSHVMRRVGPLGIETALQVIHQAALGLAKAHEQGVVHRDVKPANLFLHDGGEQGESIVKILDFGIAKVRMDLLQKADEGGLTRTGSMLGSPHYMSPEQAQGLRSIDHRSDVWSMGVVLYKMLTGQTPHAKLTTLGQVILAICAKPPRPIQELAPWVPPEVAAIVHRALQADPALRFQSMNELAQAVEPFIANVPKLRRNDIQPLSDQQRAMHAVSFHPRENAPTNGTHHGMVQSPLAPKTKSASGYAIGMIGASFLAAIAIGAVAVTLMARKPAAAAETTHVETMATTTPAPISSPSAVASNAVPAAVVAPAELLVTVKVPKSSTVEVDGNKVPVENGAVELRGPLGSVASVHVVTSTGDTTQNVAITGNGAFPSKITVTKNHGTVGSGSAAVPSATGVNVQRKFE